MKKRMLCVMAAAVLAAGLFSGCKGSGGGSAASSAVAKESEETSSSEENGSSEANDSIDSSEAETKDDENSAAVEEDNGIRPLHLEMVDVGDDVYIGDDGTDYSYSTNYPLILERHCTQVSLNEMDEEKYPRLQEKLQNLYYNEAFDRKSAFYQDLRDVAYEDYLWRDDPSTFSPFSHIESSVIMRADTKYLSYLIEVRDYTGGANVGYSYIGENFDTETGEELELRSVVREWDGFKRAVADFISEKYFDMEYEEKEVLEEKYARLLEDETYEDAAWTLGYNGVAVHLHSYRDGLQTAVIDFAGHESMFDEKYTKVPDSYAVLMDEMVPWYADIDGDGELEHIDCSPVDDLNYTCMKGWSVTIDEMETSAINDEWFFGTEPYLMKTAGGRYYILTLNSGEGDWGFTKVFDITGGSVKALDADISNDRGSCSFFRREYYSYNTKYPIMDTESFKLSTRLDVLGTYRGYRTYRLTEDGEIVPNEEYYHVNFSESPDLLQKKALPCMVVGEDMQGTEEITMEMGSGIYRIVRTDGKSWADLSVLVGWDTEGRDWGDAIIRIEIDTDWPQTVCGMDANEVFDGIEYAG